MEDKNVQESENLDQLQDMQDQNTDINTESDADEKDLQIIKLQEQVEELKDKYLRQVADYDNLRKRTARERLETMQTAGKDVISSLLVVLDDSERAEKQLQVSEDVEEMRQGVLLVFNKLRATLQSRGLKPMEVLGAEFNPDMHEAITEVPTPDENMKGKIVAEVEKGYLLNDKIIRFAKVVVGK
ncbi:MAG TPA: nucleotide exchange factor GrpE [Flavitalea sp.]|nr:nucleotide exchange factor GrpE [Flavitalea sp.]